MNLSEPNRPIFVGDSWGIIPQGYSYIHDPPNDLDLERNLDNPNEWIRLLCIFERARLGMFNSLELLPVIIRNSEDFSVRAAGLRLLGDASGDALLFTITEFYEHPDPDTRFAAYYASAANGVQTFVDALIEAILKRKRGIERDIIADALSMMLEYTPGHVCEPRNNHYEKLIRELHSQIQLRVGLDKPIRFGTLLSLEVLTDKIAELVNDIKVQEYNGGLLPDYLLLFESMTGIPCVEVFDKDGCLYTERIITLLSLFKQSDEISHYLPGQRYFFGHLINSVK